MEALDPGLPSFVFDAAALAVGLLRASGFAAPDGAVSMGGSAPACAAAGFLIGRDPAAGADAEAWSAARLFRSASMRLTTLLGLGCAAAAARSARLLGFHQVDQGVLVAVFELRWVERPSFIREMMCPARSSMSGGIAISGMSSK